jgi:hypothetical protein
MTEFRSDWLDHFTSDTGNYGTAKTDTTPFVSFGSSVVTHVGDKNDECSRCSHVLTGLPETAALGICCRCLTDAEWVDVLARMKQRRERTKTAVAARAAQLRMEQSH